MFTDIIGNDSLKETLARLLTSGRVPNAMLFTGPDGVGKRLFAIEIARSFVCRVSDYEPCGKCPACVRAGQFDLPDPDEKEVYKKVIFSHHPDVGTVIAQKRFILVDAVRDLESEAHFRPYEGRARTFIVDNADKMNPAASNALLKTLEEPASTSRIILVTSRPDSLLATIRSRCQTFRFAPIRTEQVTRFLMETKSMSEPDARLAAKISEGSVGRAAAVDIAQMRERRHRMLIVLRDALMDRDRVALMRASEKMAEAKNKEFFEADLELLLMLVRDVWAIAAGADEAAVVHHDLFHELSGLASSSDPRKLSHIITEIELIRERFVVNINKKFASDALFLKLAA